MEIISEQITYKDKNFDIKLKPIFQTIIENQYNLVQKKIPTIELWKQALKKGLKLILALIIEKTHFSVRFQNFFIKKSFLILC